MLPFISESFVFLPPVCKRINQNIENFKSFIFPVVLCGHETYLTLREEHSLGVFENRMLRRIFRPERIGITGG
jgi:hypothetical protein